MTNKLDLLVQYIEATQGHCFIGDKEMLAYARELREMEPVGFKQLHHDLISWHQSDLYPVPLYALGNEK